MIKIKTRNKYEETKAKYLLGFLPDKKYHNLQISESPDLINMEKFIGIEVTDGLKNIVHEKFSRIAYVDRETMENLNQLKIGNNKSTNDSYYLPSLKELESGYDFKRIYEKKLHKLNNVYQIFAENNLFIFGWFASEKDIIDFYYYLNDATQYIINFDYIFIMLSDGLMIYDNHVKALNFVPIKKQDIRMINRKAFEVVKKDV